MPKQPSTTPCSAPGCTALAHSRGMCKPHYDKDRQRRLPRCSVDGCLNAAALSHGLCASCRQRQLRSGTLARRKPLHRIDRRGYVAVWAPDHPMATAQGWVLEHRKVAYDAGLLVDAEHHVHHINHDKQDNRLENLEVLTADAHRALHAEENTRIDWVRARHLYETEGWSTSKVAAELGTHPGNVSRQLRRMGVQMRSGSEAGRRAWALRKAAS